MRVVTAFPPNYPEVKRHFKLPHNHRILFAYGTAIYNPGRAEVGPELIAHEEVHGARQLAMGVREWWRRYIDDTAFRLEEEVLAHRAELKVLAEGKINNWKEDLERVAHKLSDPLYGSIISYDDAVKALAA